MTSCCFFSPRPQLLWGNGREFFIIIQLKLRLTQTDVFTYTNYVTNHDRNWYDNERASDNTTKDIDPFNQKELLHKPIGEKKKKKILLGAKIQVPHLSVCLKQIFVKSLKQSTTEPASEGHSVLFVELDCPSLSLCWCKLNRLMFLPRIKYSSQLDLPVCINVINYKEKKTASSTLSQNNQTSWAREGEK